MTKALRMALYDTPSYAAMLITMPAHDYKPLRAELSAIVAAIEDRNRKSGR